MTEVASLALCKELYELSGWGTDQTWRKLTLGKAFVRNGSIEDEYDISPAYSLGYLLRKLPKTLGKYEIQFGWNEKTQFWYAGYSQTNNLFHWYCEGETIEEATAQLAIELFKEAILK